MIIPLDPAERLIVVPVRVFGPQQGNQLVLRFAIDTGSTTSILDWDRALSLGYDPAVSNSQVQTTTASGTIFAPRLMLEKLEVFREEKHRFPVLCHRLAADTGVDGLLGLDFFQQRKLTVDLRTHLVGLE